MRLRIMLPIEVIKHALRDDLPTTGGLAALPAVLQPPDTHQHPLSTPAGGRAEYGHKYKVLQLVPPHDIRNIPAGRGTSLLPTIPVDSHHLSLLRLHHTLHYWLR